MILLQLESGPHLDRCSRCHCIFKAARGLGSFPSNQHIRDSSRLVFPLLFSTPITTSLRNIFHLTCSSPPYPKPFQSLKIKLQFHLEHPQVLRCTVMLLAPLIIGAFITTTACFGYLITYCFRFCAFLSHSLLIQRWLCVEGTSPYY